MVKKVYKLYSFEEEIKIKPIDIRMPITIIANSQVSYNSMGGSDKIFIEMARVWKRLGHPITILGCREAGKMCNTGGLGDSFKEVSRFDVEAIGLFFAYAFRVFFSIFNGSLVERGVLYSSSDFFPDLIFAFRQKLLNKKIKWVAGIFLIAPNPFKVKYARNFRGFVYWISQRIGISIMRIYADLAVTLCQEDKDFLINKGIKEDKIIVISGGVDLDIISRISDQAKKYDACFVGRFHYQKGLPELIEIWKSVTVRLPNVKLAIVGWGDKYWVNAIKELIDKNNLQDNVFLLGFLDNEEKYRLIKSSRIFLFPSSYESWGIVVAEALGCGRPVVAFDINATRKFKKGVILVNPGDVNSFSDTAARLLTDREFYLELAQSARDGAANFSWEESADIILKSVFLFPQNN